jgi:aryl-alcohol dehydrogenase-like predicted oxidoreductase
MRYRKLGTSDLSVSVVCLGTMTFGEQNSQQDGFDQMDYALERGVNFFDTAELYAVMPRKETYGKTEEILGNWFQEKKNRDKIILASKIASKSDGLEWIREGSENLGFDKKNMNAAIDASLKRLKTDYIDLYQLHWPERKVPKFGQLDYKYDPTDNTWTTIEEVLFNLNELVKDGKVRHVGLSNETPWGMMKFLEVAKQKKFTKNDVYPKCL